MAFEPDGTERPLTPEELMEHLNAPEVSYEDDGSVWIYYYGEKLDITHQFDDDGVCYVQLTNGGGDCLPDCQVSKRLCDEFAEIPLSP